MITIHGINIPSAEEQLKALDAEIAAAILELQALIAARESCDKVNMAGWKLRDLLSRWNAAMNRWKLEGNSEKEYFARKEAGNALDQAIS